MAEIEVLLDFGTPYVRLDDYNAMKERYWRQAGLTQTADDEAATWKEHARALTARAEAAEAERDDLRERHDNLKTAYANLVQEAADRLTRMYSAEAEAARLRARVAELEAALATRPPGYLAALDARDEVMHILQRIAALVDVPGNAPAEEIVSAVERAVAGQGWTPGDETPAPDWYQTAESPDGGDGAFSHAYFDGAVWLGYPDNQPPMWYRPIPPLPQEPTP